MLRRFVSCIAIFRELELNCIFLESRVVYIGAGWSDEELIGAG